MVLTAKEWSLIALALLAIALVFALAEPFPQPLAYHDFADQSPVLGVPHGLNVLSNIPFLLVGLAGVWVVGQLPPSSSVAQHRLHYLVLFIGFVLTALGSSYYHYRPSNETLVWDRLGMTVAFMGFFSSVISELISRSVAKVLLPLLLVLGAFSVFYWGWTEQTGEGDLRLYGLVQFLPILLIALMLFLYQAPPGYLHAVVYLGLCYLAAKLLEHFDVPVFEILRVVSGHSLKHVFAALGGVYLIIMLLRRQQRS